MPGARDGDPATTWSFLASMQATLPSAPWVHQSRSSAESILGIGIETSLHRRDCHLRVSCLSPHPGGWGWPESSNPNDLVGSAGSQPLSLVALQKAPH